MSTIRTTTVVHAAHRLTRDDLYFEGVNGSEEGYGIVDIVRTTTTERRAEGNNPRLLDKTQQTETLATLSADEAAKMIASLGRAIVGATQVRAPYRLIP